MKKRDIFWNGLVYLSILCASSQVFGQDLAENAQNDEQPAVNVSEAEMAPSLAMPSASYSHTDTLREGDWMWGILTEQELPLDISAAASDISDPKVIYLGSPESILVSKDHGATWQETFSLQASASEDEKVDDDADDADNVRIERMREFLKQEIENKLESAELAESILDDITDDELFEAKDLSELESIYQLDLELDSDISKWPIFDEIETDTGLVLSASDTFIARYAALMSAGADENDAAGKAADSPAVWQFVPTANGIYAVTSAAVYYSADKGSTWEIAVSSSDNAILSFGVSEDGQQMVLGMAEGMAVSSDAGQIWTNIEDLTPNMPMFKVGIAADGTIWGLSPSAVFYSKDAGMSWNHSSHRLNVGENAVDISAGSGREFLVLTNDRLYRASLDSDTWDTIPMSPFDEETPVQIVSDDPSLSKFYIRTERHVFGYDNGWLDMNKTMFVTETGPLALLHDGNSFALLASPSGVMLAQDKNIIINDPDYQALLDIWKNEPSQMDVIEQAYKAHYVGDWLDKNWELRIGLSWLLPIVSFDYVYRQDRYDALKSVLNKVSGVTESTTMTYHRYERFEWSIMAHWNINFAADNGAALRNEFTMQRLRKNREQVAKLVTSNLTKRSAVQMALVLDFPKFPENISESKKKSLRKKQLRAMLTLSELESHLNYLTGGYYIPAIHQSSR